MAVDVQHQAEPTLDELRTAVAAAVRAPSVHNTQPWRFEVGRGHIDVLGDLSRRLPVLDPSGRNLVLSCGGAAACAQYALAAAGWATALDPAPEDEPDRLARIRVVERRPASPDDVAMAQAVDRRHSVRGILSRRGLHDHHLERLLGEVAPTGVTVTVLDEPSLRDDVRVLQARADAVLEADPAYREELARWVRRQPDTQDGIPAITNDALLHRAPRDWAQRSFPAGTAGPVAGPGAADDPMVLVLSAPDTRDGWLRSGAALARVLVRATQLGLAGVPMTQVAEVPHERDRLTRLLGLTGQPQALVRIGQELRPQITRPTPRRPPAATWGQP